MISYDQRVTRAETSGLRVQAPVLRGYAMN
jgi:hypothetical protein